MLDTPGLRVKQLMTQPKKWKAWTAGGLLGLALLYFSTFQNSAAPLQCLWSGDQQYELYRNGIKNPEAPFDGSPHMSISLFGPHHFDFGDASALVNVTDVVQCAPLEEAWRLSFVQIRSQRLTAALAAWRAGGDNQPRFRAGQMLRDAVDATYTGDPERWRWARNPVGVLPKAPGWLPKEQISEQNFIAFWGDGQLFSGRQPNEYYFVAYRGYVPGATP